MPFITFSARDLQQGKIITPSWYRVRVNSIGESPAKQSDKGPSTNYPVEGTVLFNGDNGDIEFANTPINWMFNSKAPGFAVGFFKSLGFDDVAEGVRYDFSAAEGKELDVFIENDVWQGRTVNRVNHKYRLPKSDVTANS